MYRVMYSCYGWCFDWVTATALVRRYAKQRSQAPPSTGVRIDDDGDDSSDSSVLDHREDTLHFFNKASQWSKELLGVDGAAPNIVISETASGSASQYDESPSRMPCDGCETPFSMNSSPVTSIDKLLGKLLVTAQYFASKQKLEITVKEGYKLQLLANDSLSQVRVVLLPDKREKRKTRFIEGQNPKYDETFTFAAIEQEHLAKKIVRLRVYRKRQSGRHQLLGETALRLCLIDGRGQTCTNHLLNLSSSPDSNLNLFPSDMNYSSSRRSSMVDDAGRFCSSPAGKGTPELQMSLCYDDRTGKMIVGLEKGSCFGIHLNLPDTFVKVTALSPYGDEIGKHKTEIIKASNDPVFDVSFVFQIPYSELRYTSVLVQVYSLMGVWKRRQLIGWFSLGQNCTSTVEEDHWGDMIQGMGTPVSKWHVLIES